jgi:hypothetical protein
MKWFKQTTTTTTTSRDWKVFFFFLNLILQLVVSWHSKECRRGRSQYNNNNFSSLLAVAAAVVCHPRNCVMEKHLLYRRCRRNGLAFQKIKKREKEIPSPWWRLWKYYGFSLFHKTIYCWIEFVKKRCEKDLLFIPARHHQKLKNLSLVRPNSSTQLSSALLYKHKRLFNSHSLSLSYYYYVLLLSVRFGTE